MDVTIGKILLTCLETTRQWSPMPPSLLPLSPQDPILLPTTEFKKQLQQAISSTIGRMENPTVQTSLVNIGNMLLQQQSGQMDITLLNSR